MSEDNEKTCFDCVFLDDSFHNDEEILTYWCIQHKVELINAMVQCSKGIDKKCEKFVEVNSTK